MGKDKAAVENMLHGLMVLRSVLVFLVAPGHLCEIQYGREDQNEEGSHG